MGKVGDCVGVSVGSQVDMFCFEVCFLGALLLDRSGGLGKVRAMSSWKRSECE